MVLTELPKIRMADPFPDVMAHARLQTPPPEGWSFPKCNKYTKSSFKTTQNFRWEGHETLVILCQKNERNIER